MIGDRTKVAVSHPRKESRERERYPGAQPPRARYECIFRRGHGDPNSALELRNRGFFSAALIAFVFSKQGYRKETHTRTEILTTISSKTGHYR